MDPKNAIDYAEEVKEEYDQLRTEFFAGLKDVIYSDLKVTRDRPFVVRAPRAQTAGECFFGAFFWLHVRVCAHATAPSWCTPSVHSRLVNKCFVSGFSVSACARKINAWAGLLELV